MQDAQQKNYADQDGAGIILITIYTACVTPANSGLLQIKPTGEGLGRSRSDPPRLANAKMEIRQRPTIKAGRQTEPGTLF